MKQGFVRLLMILARQSEKSHIQAVFTRLLLRYEKAVLPATGLNWLIAGGLVYTLGVVFYILDHTKYFIHSHGIWHFFVLGGSICHFIFVIGYLR